MNHDATIATYNANLDVETWAQMRDFVRGTIRFRYAPHHSPSDVKNALTILSSFVDWVLFTGVGEADVSILQSALIDSYVASRETEVLPYVAARERKTLRAIAGLPNITEHDRTSTTAPLAQPYSPEDQGAIRRWAETQPTARRRTLCGVVVALTLGAGLTLNETMHVRERDVVTLEDGLVGVLVDFRIIPVSADWHDALAPFSDSTSDSYVVAPGTSVRTRASMRSIVGRTPTHSWYPSVQRMRNTWLVRCLDAGVPVQNLVEASGLNTPEMLRRLFPYLTKLEGAPAVRAFRLAGEVVGR